MNRNQLAQVLHAASRIVTDGDILVIGSQSILGTYSEDQLPDAAVASIEVDIAFFDDPSYEKGDLVDAVLGEMSPFHETTAFMARVSRSQRQCCRLDGSTGWSRRRSVVFRGR